MNKSFTRILVSVFTFALLIVGVNATKVMAYSPCDLYDTV